MIHIGKNTKSTIISKGISAGYSQNSYRGLVRIAKEATKARNYSQCDSLLLGDKCGAHTWPFIECNNNRDHTRHEAFYIQNIGRSNCFIPPAGDKHRKCHRLIVNVMPRRVKTPSHGVCRELQKLAQRQLGRKHRIKYYFQYK